MSFLGRCFTKRRSLRLMVVAVVFVAMGCGTLGICGSETTTLTLTPTPTAAATKAAAAATGAATTAATSAATTAATASGTAAGGGTYSGTAKLGVDHPPFLIAYAPGGRSYALFCGTLTGANGGTLTANLTGTTGQPPSVTGAIGPDGKFSIPIPIQQFGSLSATVTSVKAASGATLTGSVTVPPLTVDSPEVACTP